MNDLKKYVTPKTLHYPERFLRKSLTPKIWQQSPIRGSVMPIPAFRGNTVFCDTKLTSVASQYPVPIILLGDIFQNFFKT